jgi:hypothetical protein
MSSVMWTIGGVMAVAAIAAVFATSCLSVRLSSMKDEQLVQGGVDAWNTKKTEDARPYWEAIRDAETKSRYLSYFDKLDELESLQGAAVAAKPGEPARQEAAYDAFVAKYKAFPAELKLPADLKEGMRPVAVGIAKAKVRAGKMEAAQSFIKEAVSLFGDSPEYGALQKEMDAYARVQEQEREADRSYASAKGVEDFNAKIDAYEAAQAAYRKVESASASEMKKLGAGSDSILAAQSASLRKKRGAVRIEEERLVRDRGTTFKERIGEEFARQPEGNKLGNMGPEDILKFNEEIRANIESQYKDIIAFSDRFPSVIDKDMIRDIDLQKASLDARISQIEAEVRHAKDIASRGKAAMPLLIGLFNPVPGSKAEGEKSRPAVIRGKMAGEADYWWGMVSIEPGKMNDLVVTMKDGKAVEVYAENTLSGTQIKKKKLPDLVSKGSRIGNSWPVLNAGAVLKNGQYYIKISSNGNPSYSGEVVVYSSFISRVR